MAKYKHLELSTHLIDMMLQRNDFIQAFPFISQYKKVKVARACCGGRRRQTSATPDYNLIKQAFATMSAQDKLKLRQMLDTEVLSITYLVGNSARTVTIS